MKLGAVQYHFPTWEELLWALKRGMGYRIEDARRSIAPLESLPPPLAGLGNL